MARSFGYRDGIAVFQIVAFSALLLCAGAMARLRKNGWFSIGALAIIRLVGASCLLVTLWNNSSSVWAGVYVCESLGVLLLTFLLLGMLERANWLVRLLHPRFFRLPKLISWAGIGLTIADFSLAASRGNDYDPLNPYGVAGLAMFLALYLLTAAIAAYFFVRRAAFEPGGSGSGSDSHQQQLLPSRPPSTSSSPSSDNSERRQIECVAVCVPVLAVRVAYTLAGRLSRTRVFNPVSGGNPTAYLAMVALPEVAIASLCTAAILWYGRDWRQYEKVPGERVAEEQGLQPLTALRRYR